MLARVYRGLITPLCFVCFNIGALTLSLIWFHALNLLVRSPLRRQQLARHSLTLSFRFFIRVLCLLRIIEVHTEGLARLKSLKGHILVANHPSLIDYVILTACLDNLNCVVKEELSHNFFCKGVIKAAGYLINAASVLDKSRVSLERGENLLIFPEGTRTSRSKPFKLHRGAAALAVHLQRPLTVITIALSEEFLSKEKRWYALPEHCPRYVLSAGPTLEASAFILQPEEAELTPLLTRRLNRHLTELLGAVGYPRKEYGT